MSNVAKAFDFQFLRVKILVYIYIILSCLPPNGTIPFGLSEGYYKLPWQMNKLSTLFGMQTEARNGVDWLYEFLQ